MLAFLEHDRRAIAWMLVTLEVEDGGIDEIDVAGGISATGADSDAVHLSHADIPGLDHTTISSAAGEQIVRA